MFDTHIFISSISCFFFFSCSANHRALHSFPTRRSSDLHALHDGESYLVDQFSVSYAPSASIYALCQQKQKIDRLEDRKSTRLNSSHANISYAVFCLKKKKMIENTRDTQR